MEAARIAREGAGSVSPTKKGTRKGVYNHEKSGTYTGKRILKAFDAVRINVPENTAPEVAALADEAIATVLKVMRGQTGRHSLTQLTAAGVIRDEICGPIKQRLSIEGAGGPPRMSVTIDMSPQPPTIPVLPLPDDKLLKP